VYEFRAADEKQIKALNNNYRVISPISMGSPALSVQFYGRSTYTPKALEELLPIKEQITEIGLAKIPVKDDDLKPLLQFKNLRKLNLNYTDVTARGLKQLTALKKLNALAISGTAVSAEVATELVKLPELKALYVWNTALDSTAIAALLKVGKGVRIERGFKDNGENILPLNPPVAKTVSGVYDLATPIELKHSFKGVEIRYTLDGTEPDSVKSPVYTQPLKLDRFTIVKAKAFKQGWYGSKSIKAVYFISGVKPDSVALFSKEPQLAGKERLLFDKVTGDLSLGAGTYLELKQPTTFLFFFKEPVMLQQLAMNTFVRMESDIFPVARLEVWGGMKNESLAKLGTWSQAVFSKKEGSDVEQPTVHFIPKKLSYIKVVVQPLASMPSWHGNKGKPSKVLVGEVVLN
jgi:hypothetical protein